MRRIVKVKQLSIHLYVGGYGVIRIPIRTYSVLTVRIAGLMRRLTEYTNRIESNAFSNTHVDDSPSSFSFVIWICVLTERLSEWVIDSVVCIVMLSCLIR